jgi:hypothetical protein
MEMMAVLLAVVLNSFHSIYTIPVGLGDTVTAVNLGNNAISVL